MSKAQIAGTAPLPLEVEAGKRYFWCSCGQSKSQPLCDGSHKGSEFTPVAWVADESRKVFCCTCKQTDKAPLCDGSHNSL